MNKEIHGVYDQRVKYAYSKVLEIQKKEACVKEFRSLARSFPSMIQVNGLGAAIAALKVKAGKQSAAEHMYKSIGDWLQEQYDWPKGQEDIIQKIISQDSVTYRLYMQEIMSLCIWLKRFAEAMLDVREDEKND